MKFLLRPHAFRYAAGRNATLHTVVTDAVVIAVLSVAACASASLTTRMEAAQSIHVYRLGDQLLSSADQLEQLGSLLRADDQAALSPANARVLKALVADAGSYEQKMAFVPACGFVASFVFEFRSQAKPPVWWIVTNCGKAALVDAHTIAAQWDDYARFLTTDANTRLEMCNAKWEWGAAVSCLK